MKRLASFLIIMMVFTSLLPAISLYDRVGVGINEGHTRKIKDNLDFRTNFLLDNRLGAEVAINENLNLFPFALARFSSRTITAPMITFKSHFDIGLGAGVNYSLNRKLRLNAELYTGTGLYLKSDTKLAFVGVNLGMEYLIGKGVYLTPQLQLERASYQDSFAFTLGVGAKL